MTALAVLLGVTVTDVRRERIYDGERQPDANAWRLELAGGRFGLDTRSGPGTAAGGHGRSRAGSFAAEPRPTPCPTHAASLSHRARPRAVSGTLRIAS